MTLTEVFQVFSPDFVADIFESAAAMLGVATVGYLILWFFTDRSL